MDAALYVVSCLGETERLGNDFRLRQAVSEFRTVLADFKAWKENGFVGELDMSKYSQDQLKLLEILKKEYGSS